MFGESERMESSKVVACRRVNKGAQRGSTRSIQWVVERTTYVRGSGEATQRASDCVREGLVGVGANRGHVHLLAARVAAFGV